MLIKNRRSITSEAFTIDRKDKMLIIESSTLRPLCDPMGRLYDDACDVGFSISSQGTGVKTYWYLSEEVEDGEGDLEVTIYRPISETLREFPALSGWSAHILNT
jgi:hypothetical protein